MNRWLGKVAVVTGASSGIGSAIAIDLANAGMIVVGLARRQHRIDELHSKLAAKCTGSLHSFKCDVSNEKDVLAAFAWICSKFGGVDVLVNNAGILRPGQILDANNTKAMREVIDTNLTGTVFCVREAFASMKARKVIDGHIILINSICGHDVPRVPGVSFNIYPCTKYAITAMTEVLRQELLAEGTTIKVTVCASEFGKKKCLRNYYLFSCSECQSWVGKNGNCARLLV